MTRKPATQTSEVPGIDLSFRPPSYFWPLSLETHLLTHIKGAERKAEVQRLIDAGRIDEIPAFLREPSLNDAVRQFAGRIHPAFMGGEYLPDFTSHEVEIARITIASTTRDVTSVYARRRKNRIFYRVVDEYDGGTLMSPGRRTSIAPLTLGELEAFFNSAWSIFGVLAMNFGSDGYPVDQMLRFVVSVESQFYRQIGELYERRIRAWAAPQQAKPDSDHAQDGDLEPAIIVGPEPRHG